MRRLVVVAALAALLLGGCGIPDETNVTVVGAGSPGGTGARDDSTPRTPNTRESASDPQQLLQYYLEAAAGDRDGTLNPVKAFLSESARKDFDPANAIRVIRLKGDPVYTPTKQLITFSAQTVGTLDENGSLQPLDADTPVDVPYAMRIGPVAGQSGFFVLDAPKPNVLLLSDTALDDFYQRRTIYFWNTDNTALIPDLRYMSSTVPSAQQPTTILKWLRNGPAGWLSDAAHGLPDGTESPENVPAPTNDTLTVTLNDRAVPNGDPKALDRLRKQLQWSLLQPDQGPRTLELKIKGQDPVRYSDADYLASNPAFRLADAPQRFVVYNGVIRRLARSPQANDPVPAIRPEDNKGLAAAAMSTSSTHTFVAVVTGGKGPKLRVGSARTGVQAALADVTGVSGSLGRPVWAVTADNDPKGAVGLITANGRLYSFGPGGGRAQPVDWEGGPGAITAVSVAPDGTRVAIVAGGTLYRATLDTSGDTVTLNAAERLFPPTFSSVAAVAWSSETYLAVAGLSADGERYAVLDVTVDGALQYTRSEDIGNEAVTYLTAYPSNPVSRGEHAVTESYEAAGAAWDVFGEPVRIGTSALAGPTPSPGGKSTPTAPFFLN